MLYKCFDATRIEYLSKHKKISEYDSENLMYSIIEEVLANDNFSKLSVVTHQPLNAIIRVLHKLDDNEARYPSNVTHLDKANPTETQSVGLKIQFINSTEEAH